MLRAGFGKVCISPGTGAPLAGFAAREGVSEGIHDDLFARALVLSDDQTTLALVSVDLLALPSEFVRRVRERDPKQNRDQRRGGDDRIYPYTCRARYDHYFFQS